MNKYQKALDRLKNETIPNPYIKQHNDEDFDTIQELITNYERSLDTIKSLHLEILKLKNEIDKSVLNG